MIKKALLNFSSSFANRPKPALSNACSAWNLPQRRTVGIYNNPLLNALHEQSAPVWVERAAHIQESMGLTRGKTDQVDAKRIALFAYKNREEVRLWKPKRPVLAQLDRLTAQRARLVKVIKMLQTPLTDSEGFIDKADRKADQQACKASLKALKADRYGGPAESS